MSLQPGEKLGPYEILCPIGAGGMGEVYKARDTRLEREVAVKVLQEHLDSDPLALPRFEREAKAVAALSHPNILAIHDFGREGGVTYAVMELLEGRTLAQVLRPGPLPVPDVVEIALQVAKGLAAAHEKGIVHRDLKPGNVFITKDDQVKILDFGLARLPAKRGADAQPLSERLAGDTPTQDGTILGTVDYMAPEQARGDPVDARSDVFAFGVLLYEMLSGSSPFDRGSVAETLAALLKEDPPPLPPSLPPFLSRIVLRCLQKRPEERFTSARDLVLALRDLSGVGVGATLPQRVGGGGPSRGLSVLAIALVLAPALLWWPLSLLKPVRAVENWLVDVRFLFAKGRAPDPRIVLVSLDEPSLAADPSPIMGRADEFGAALTKIFAQDPAGVAVDLLLPEKWGESESFAGVVTAHSKKLVLAAYSTPEGAVLGPECLKGPVTISLGAEAASGLFGFVNITRDRDGAVRRERRAFQDAEGKARSTLSAKAAGLLRGGAGRAASDGKPFLVDFSVDPEKLPRVSWKDLAAVLDEGEGCFRGKLVLVGAEYAASGDVSYRVPHRRGGKDEISGLVLNALSVNTLLEGARISDAPRMAAAILLGSTLLLAGFWFLGRPKSATWWAVCLVLCGLYVASSFVVSREFGIFLPLAGPGVACLLSAGGMLWVGIKTGL